MPVDRTTQIKLPKEEQPQSRTLVKDGCFCLLPKIAWGVTATRCAGRVLRAGAAASCLPATKELCSCGAETLRVCMVIILLLVISKGRCTHSKLIENLQITYRVRKTGFAVERIGCTVSQLSAA